MAWNAQQRGDFDNATTSQADNRPILQSTDFSMFRPMTPGQINDLQIHFKSLVKLPDSVIPLVIANFISAGALTSAEKSELVFFIYGVGLTQPDGHKSAVLFVCDELL